LAHSKVNPDASHDLTLHTLYADPDVTEIHPTCEEDVLPIIVAALPLPAIYPQLLVDEESAKPTDHENELSMNMITSIDFGL
jgi:hypothetical protein